MGRQKATVALETSMLLYCTYIFIVWPTTTPPAFRHTSNQTLLTSRRFLGGVHLKTSLVDLVPEDFHSIPIPKGKSIAQPFNTRDAGTREWKLPGGKCWISLRFILFRTDLPGWQNLTMMVVERTVSQWREEYLLHIHSNVACHESIHYRPCLFMESCRSSGVRLPL